MLTTRQGKHTPTSVRAACGAACGRAGSKPSMLPSMPQPDHTVSDHSAVRLVRAAEAVLLPAAAVREAAGDDARDPERFCTKQGATAHSVCTEAAARTTGSDTAMLSPFATPSNAPYILHGCRLGRLTLAATRSSYSLRPESLPSTS